MGYGSAASYRSAFMNALKQHRPRLKLSDSQAEEMGELFKTFKKLDARRRQEKGLGARTTGKAPLRKEVYRDMSQWFLMNNGDATGWAHLYLNLTWNLMCRVDNTDLLSMADLGWEDDSLTVRFCKGKTDHSGSKRDLKRHVFANPLDCIMCPVTALGLYLLTVSGTAPHLFSHSRRQKSLGEYLHAYFGSEAGKAICRKLGLEPSKFGTDSIRKGSTAFSICGSTAGPNALAALTRGGWATGASWERYVYLVGAGQDAYIGRLLAGLPVMEPDFALLPPHFDPLDEEVAQLVKGFYGRVLESHPHLAETLAHCLASIVHHADTLRELLPSSHYLAHHELFSNRELLDRLRGLLYRDNKYSSPFMQSTGIPPHSLQLREMRRMQEQMEENHRQAQRQREETNERFLHRLEQLIERRTLEQGGVTPALLQSMLRDTLSELRELSAPDLGSSPQQGRADTPSQQGGAADMSPGAVAGLQVYSWGGGFHLVPEDWRLPTNVNLKTGWELWCRGQPVPYRRLSSRDRQRDRQRYNEWKSVFGKMVVFLKAKNAWVEEPSREQTQAMFVRCLPLLQQLLPKARRLEELRPSYACRQFRSVSESRLQSIAHDL